MRATMCVGNQVHSSTIIDTMKKQFVLLATCMLLLYAPLAGYAQPAAGNGNSLPQLVAQYTADRDNLDRVYIFKNSPEYYDRISRYDADMLAVLKSTGFKELPVSDQVDYLLLKRNIEEELRDLQQDRQLYQQLVQYLPFAAAIQQLQQKRRRGSHLDGAATADTLTAVKNAIRHCMAAFEKAPAPDAGQNRKLYAVLEELREGLQQTWTFYNGYDPQFTWWVKQPYTEADSLLGSYAQLVKKQASQNSTAQNDASGIAGHPIGSAALKEALQFEMIPYSAEQLVEIANREFAWCDAEMRKAAAAMGFGDDWKKALEKVKQNHVAPGYQPEMINRLAEEAIRFVEANNLVTIPPLAKETWRMSMLSVEQQRFAPFFLGGESILIAYPTDEMDEATKQMSLRSNNYGFSHATVFHELIPGHNLQGFMNRRYKAYRSPFRTPFSVEGWALYWEMLLWDKNFHVTPEEKVGALFWRMHRCARIIFSLNYHLGKWTPQQCIDFLVERVGHERFSATSEVRRSFEGNYGPLYQVAYMMGGLQLRALHHELVDSGKMTDKQLHDAFLKENAIPIELFRAIVTGQQLSPDYTTQWRFAGDL